MELSHYGPNDKMLLADVTMLALNLMNEHGLIEAGWIFEWDRARNRNGACKYGPKVISLSRIRTPARTYSEIRNTITHEVAHALVGAKNGHNEIWRAKAISIGCDGKRCSATEDTAALPEHRWMGRCAKCDLSCGYHRAPNRVRSCPKCSPWGFDVNSLIIWEEHGKVVPIHQMPTRYQKEWNMIQESLGPILVGAVVESVAVEPESEETN